MPSKCPRCHGTVDDDAVCCAGMAYTWKCTKCHKVCTGFAVPYGKCFLCGGELQVIEGRAFDDPLKIRPIRDAVQFELNAYHFYKLALKRVQEPTLRAVFEQMYQHEVDHLHMLQDRYHTHLDEQWLDLRPDAETLLADSIFRGIDLADTRGGVLALYDKAIEMEKRTQDHFRRLASEIPAGPEHDVCLELAAEEEEHVALLETEREQFVGR